MADKRHGCLALVALFLAAAAVAREPQLSLPPGFSIEVWAADVPGARSLAQAPDGTVFVSTRREGKVYALHDADGDGRPEPALTLASGLQMPNGVAWRSGDLYVAEVGRILRYPAILQQLQAPPPPQVVRTDLPGETAHGWRSIAFGPDGKLYLSMGAPCNVCALRSFERDGQALSYGSITRMNPDGSGWERVAQGVRNSVGFDWNPADGRLWFTDNGRDWLGDDRPDCELNRVDAKDQDFGFPRCHAGDVADPEFGGQQGCAGTVPPVLKLGAHVAPLGMRFYGGRAFPEPYRGAIFIALHGSWNRSRKSGYRVVWVQRQGQEYRLAPFVEGWLDGERASGRPVDLLERADGSLLISDDLGGRIYRVRYSGADPPTRMPAGGAGHIAPLSVRQG